MMADLSTYVVLALIVLPPLLRQAQRLVDSVRSARQPRSASQTPPPRFLSQARLTPFASPFSATVSLVTAALLLTSLRNLIPVQYGFDIFIPASAFHNLRRLFSILCAAPGAFDSIQDDIAPLHIEAFRGAYKPDLFLAYSAPITIPTTTLRSLINDTPSLLPIGLLTQSKKAELQALIARLSSYEGRRMYLLLGSRPLLDCTFCNKTNDYFWYAVPFLLRAYAWRILALGLLTTHPDDSVAVAIRQAASLLGLSSRNSVQHTPGAKVNDTRYQADRSSWRTTSLILLASMLAVELLVIFEFGQVTSDASRFNHWHTNLHILRQLVFLPLVLVVYLFPAPRVLGSFEQGILHLDSAQQSLQNLLLVSDLVDVTHSLIVEDDRLLGLTRDFKDGSSSHAGGHVGSERAASIIQAAKSQGGQAASHAIDQAQAGIRSATRHWWQTAEHRNRQVDQQQSTTNLPDSVITSPESNPT